MNPIKQSLDAHRFDGYVTCEQIAGVPPFSWRKWLLKWFVFGLICEGLALFASWMLINLAAKEVVQKFFP